MIQHKESQKNYKKLFSLGLWEINKTSAFLLQIPILWHTEKQKRGVKHCFSFMGDT